MENMECLKNLFRNAKLNLTEEQAQQFYDYYELLIKKNEVMNLTAITDFEEIVTKHFIDSLTLGKIVNLNRDLKLIDVGTGAGFPGIPLKILYPQLHVLLLDSLNKRVQFLNGVIDQLGLTGIEAIHGRAEDIAKRIEYREQFDICVSRAVANLASLSEYCIPFVKLGGYFIPYKSGKVELELGNAKKAITVLGAKVVQKEEFILPGSDIFRCILIIQKDRVTPKKYPRKAGMPTKEPIQ